MNRAPRRAHLAPLYSLFALLCPMPALAGALDALPSVVGAGENQGFTSAIPAGDLDGDGRGDLVLGSPYDDSTGMHEAGGIYVLYDVADLDPYSLIADHAVFLGGEAEVDHAGYEVISVGDMNLDGYPELAVGAPDATSDTAPISGKVYIIYSDGQRLEDGSLGEHPAIVAAEKYTRLGTRLFAIGNADGDPEGRADLLFGVPWPTPNGDVATGWAGLLYSNSQEFGDGTPQPLRMAFDLNSTPPQWKIEGAQAGFVVEGAGTFFGASATRTPDVDGDGIDDLMIGAPHLLLEGIGESDEHPDDFVVTGPGMAFVLPMRSVPEQQAMPVLLDSYALGSIRGDLNGDHLPWTLERLADDRVAVAVPERDEERGGVYLLSELGTLGLTIDDADAGYEGEERADLTGWGLADAADLSPSGPVAIGTPGWELGRGKVSFVSDVSGRVDLSSAEVIALEGCWIDGGAGTQLATHPGPDPHGEDRQWMGLVAPRASINAFSDGLAMVLTQQDLADAAEAECEAFFDPRPEGDADGDGFTIDDCDDSEPAIYPRAPEVCGNGIDEDCDGEDADCVAAEEAASGCGGCAQTGSGLAPLGWVGLIGLGLALGRRRRGPRVAAVAGVGLAGSALAQEPVWPVDAEPVADLWGSTGFEYLRGPVVSGDYDGDGDADLAIGNYQGISTEYAVGKVYLVDHDKVQGNFWLEEADSTILGGAEHDYLGDEVLTLPPLEGDAEHLLVGSTHLGLTENEQGEVFLFNAPRIHLPATVPATDPEAALTDLTLKGTQPGDGFGHAIRHGDLDGDGMRDVAIASPFEDSVERDGNFPLIPEQGRVWILHEDRIYGEDLPASFVDSMATASVLGVETARAPGWRLEIADLDGDGYDELIVGTLGQDNENFGGELNVFSQVGPQSEALSIVDWDGRWILPVRDMAAGQGLDAGDIDGDGDAELLVGAPAMELGMGRVWMLDGLPEGTEELDDAAIASISGSAEAWGIGHSVAIGPALLLGAPGSAHVLATDADFEPLGRFSGEALSLLGEHVSWVGDFTDDGTPDVALVAPAMSDRRDFQGVAWIHSGQAILDGTLPERSTPTGSVDDADLDGSWVDQDCDDYDPQRSPNFVELCSDGIDNDCDGVVDPEDCKRSGCDATGLGAAGLSCWLVVSALAARRRRA